MQHFLVRPRVNAFLAAERGAGILWSITLVFILCVAYVTHPELVNHFFSFVYHAFAKTVHKTLVPHTTTTVHP